MVIKKYFEQFCNNKKNLMSTEKALSYGLWKISMLFYLRLLIQKQLIPFHVVLVFSF